jgi:hypothetical protein
MMVWQAAHSWKNRQASVGIDNVSQCAQCGQRRSDRRIGEVMPLLVE